MWVTETEAFSYLALKPEGEEFAPNTGDAIKFLAEAQRRIQNSPLYSFPEVPTQKMKDAVIEYAFAIFGGDEATDLKLKGVNSYRVGKFAIGFDTSKFDPRLSQFPTIVENLLDEYLTGLNTTAQINRDEDHW